MSTHTEHKYAQLARNASVVAFFTALSRITGLARDIIVIHCFGASFSMDAFNIAFTIPNTLRNFVAEGALTAAFIPIYTEILKDKGIQAAKSFYQSVFGLLLIILIVLIFLGIIFAPYFVFAFASGFNTRPEQIKLTISLTRWVFSYIFFVSLIALSMGVLNSHKHFAIPAISPILLNITMIICVYVFYSYFNNPIYTLAVGVIIGGFLQLIIQIPILNQNRLLLRPNFKINNPFIKKFISTIFPSMFGIAIYQINIMSLRQIGSYLPIGQITYFSMADRLIQVPLGIFAISIATATLPTMSEHVLMHPKNNKALVEIWHFSTRLTTFITIPAAFGLISIGLPIASVLFYHGAYTWEATKMTAYIVIALSPGLIALSFSRTTIQAFYAIKDMKTPTIIAAIVLVLNILIAVFMIRFETIGLAISLTISSFIQTFFLIFALKKKAGNLEMKLIFYHIGKQVLLSLIMCAIVYYICSFGNWVDGPSMSNIALLLFSILSGIIIYIGLSFKLNLKEIEIIKKFRLTS